MPVLYKNRTLTLIPGLLLGLITVLISSANALAQDNGQLYSVKIQSGADGELSFSDKTKVQIPDNFTLIDAQFQDENDLYGLYQTGANKAPQIFHINFEEKELTQITDLENGVRCFTLSENKVFFVPEKLPQSIMKIEGKKVEDYSSAKHKISSFQLSDNAFYYTDPKSQLYRCGNESMSCTLIEEKMGSLFTPLETTSYSYVYKFNREYWYLKEWLLSENDSRIIVRMPKKVDDYFMFSKGVFVSYSGNQLCTYRRDRDLRWRMHETELMATEHIDWLAWNGVDKILLRTRTK